MKPAEIVEHFECLPGDKVELEFRVSEFCDVYLVAVKKEQPPVSQ